MIVYDFHMRRIIGNYRLLPALAALLVLLLLAACNSARGETWRRIQEEGVLRIGVDPTYPPFATLEGDTLVGIDADLGRALAADLGLEAEFRALATTGFTTRWRRSRDLLISALVAGRR